MNTISQILNLFTPGQKPTPTGFINVRDFGAKGAGTSDDAPAIQKALDYVAKLGSGTVYFPAGDYRVGKTLSVVQGRGINMLGDGADNTMLRAGGCAVFAANGLWRSTFEQLSFRALGPGATAVFEVDGNFDGKNTMGVQGNVFRSCYFDAAGQAPYAFAMCRQGGGAGQGSENAFYSCNADGGKEACAYFNGMNALNNTWIGGNLQAYPKNGFEIIGGNINIVSVGFQSTYGWQQILNDGWDINLRNVATNNQVAVIGCRSESGHFLSSGFSCLLSLIGVRCVPAFLYPWIASSPVAVGATVLGYTALGTALIYLCTAGGVTGAAPPAWPQSGTVQDGSAVWTAQSGYEVIHVDKGTVQEVMIPDDQFLYLNMRERVVTATANYCASYMDETIYIDASKNDVAISLPAHCQGIRFLIVRIDSSDHKATVNGGSNGFFAGEQSLLPGGYIEPVYEPGAGKYYIVGQGKGV